MGGNELRSFRELGAGELYHGRALVYFSLLVLAALVRGGQ